MAATDLRRQFLAEKSQLLSFWRANVRREVSIDGGSPPLWSKENQLGKLGGGQPGETAAIVSPTEGQAPVAVQTVPAQVGDLERFAAHGLHWVPEERLYFTNLDKHDRCRPLNDLEFSGWRLLPVRWNDRLGQHEPSLYVGQARCSNLSAFSSLHCRD